MNIFVSYTLKDSFLNIEMLRHIEDILSNFGVPYIDILHNKSLNPQQHVIKMLQKSSVFCALITPQYFESRWVQIEIGVANYKSIPVIAIDMVNNYKVIITWQPKTV
ncbi:MAG: TIR domain-containing protein [Sphaerospermopsis sp.]|nr:TIR domain-containing protein [Sphaerospermopsis sp.]